MGNADPGKWFPGQGISADAVAMQWLQPAFAACPGASRNVPVNTANLRFKLALPLTWSEPGRNGPGRSGTPGGAQKGAHGR